MKTALLTKGAVIFYIEIFSVACQVKELGTFRICKDSGTVLEFLYLQFSIRTVFKNY